MLAVVSQSVLSNHDAYQGIPVKRETPLPECPAPCVELFHDIKDAVAVPETLVQIDIRDAQNLLVTS